MAIVTGAWRLRQIYDAAYFPIAVSVWLLGAFGQLPRVKRSTKNEGHERRYFYGSVWAVCIAQPSSGFCGGAAALALVRRDQARGLRRHPGLRRQPGAARAPAAHAADRPGRARGLRLSRRTAHAPDTA